MSSRRRQLNVAIEEVFLDEQINNDSVNKDTAADYEKLNAKCDTVISKIKNRKKNKNQPQTT